VKKEPKVRKPKPPTREELVRQVAQLTEQLAIERRLSQNRLDAMQSKDKTVDTLKTLIAGHERRSALLEGYIERSLQEERARAITANPEQGIVRDRVGNMEHVGQFTPFTMPMMHGAPAHVVEKDSYGRTTKSTEWQNL
jgi:hypothetical protein